MKILILAHYSNLGPCTRYRFFQYMPALEEQGCAFEVDSLYLDSMFRRKMSGRNYLNLPLLAALYVRRVLRLLGASKYDCILIEKEVLPLFPAWCDLAFMKYVNARKVLDYDDAVFHKYEDSGKRLLKWVCGGKIVRLMRAADATIVGNQYLYDHAVRNGANGVVKIPTVVDATLNPTQRVQRADGEIRIGWIGTNPNSRHLKSIEPALIEIASKFAIKLHVIGGAKVALDSRIPVVYLPWSEAEEARLLADLDVGIMPLYDGPWERGKCGLKLVQYMAASLPVVASGIGANREIVRHGITGYLCDEQSEWVPHLSKLCASATRRRRMGIAGRRRFERLYSLQSRTPQFARTLGLRQAGADENATRSQVSIGSKEEA